MDDGVENLGIAATPLHIEAGDVFKIEVRRKADVWYWVLLDTTSTPLFMSEQFSDKDDAFVNAQDFLFAIREARVIIKEKE
jgi:uncharacterized protein YqjF (DUF2071 family)